MLHNLTLLFFLSIGTLFLTFGELTQIGVCIRFLVEKFRNNDSSDWTNSKIFCIIIIIFHIYIFLLKLKLLYSNIFFSCPSSKFFIKKLIILYIPNITSEILFIYTFTIYEPSFVSKDVVILSFTWVVVLFLYDVRMGYITLKQTTNRIHHTENNIIENNILENRNSDTNTNFNTNNNNSLDEYIEIDIDPSQDCCICLEEMQKGIKLTCNHILHKECMKKWHQIKQSCPLCRNKEINNVKILVE